MPIHSIHDARRALSGALSLHADMTADGQRVLGQILEIGAANLTAQPHLEDEALRHVFVFKDKLVSRAIPGPIDEMQVQLALRDICPLFPFC